MKSIAYTPAAVRQLAKLSAKGREQVRGKLARYAETGAGDVRALVGRPGARLRVGDYRVIFLETATDIQVIAVGDRRDIYT